MYWPELLKRKLESAEADLRERMDRDVRPADGLWESWPNTRTGLSLGCRAIGSA